MALGMVTGAATSWVTVLMDGHARGVLPGMLLGTLAVSCLWGRGRYGSLGWGLLVWACAVLTTALALWLLLVIPTEASFRQICGQGGCLLLGNGCVHWSLLGAALGERLGRPPSRRRLGISGGIFAVALLSVVLGSLLMNQGPGVAIGARVVLAFLGVVVMNLGFSALASILRAPLGQRPVCGRTLLNSLCGYGVFASGCSQAPPLALISALCGRRRVAVLRGCTRIWMRLVYAATPTVRWRFRGAVQALDGRALVVANHESMLDILSASALPGQRNLLAKTWVFRAPFLGLGARFAGIHNVDALPVEAYRMAGDAPDAGTPAPGGSAAATALLGTSEGLFVFPEGRRSRSGVLGRFHLGAFHLAIAHDLPVVPVAMCGSSWSLPPQLIWIHPGELHSLVLPPMPRQASESARGYAERVRAALAEAALAGRRELVGCRFNRLNRRGWQLGRPWRERRLAAREDQAVSAVLGAVAANGAWLQLGAGQAAASVLLRQLAPAAEVRVLEPSAARRGWMAMVGIPRERLLAQMPSAESIRESRLLVLWDDPVLVCAALSHLRPRRLVVVATELLEPVARTLDALSPGLRWSCQRHGAYSVLHPVHTEGLEPGSVETPDDVPEDASTDAP